MSRPLYPRRRGRIPIVEEALWAPEPVWTGAENVVPTGVLSPNRSSPPSLLFYPCLQYLKSTEVGSGKECAQVVPSPACAARTCSCISAPLRLATVFRIPFFRVLLCYLRSVECRCQLSDELISYHPCSFFSSME
jgi:hypothetical protein